MNEPYDGSRRKRQMLTEREVDIMRLVAIGASNAEAAEALGMKPNTLRTHKQNIITKLHVHRMAHAVAFCYERGILVPGYLARGGTVPEHATHVETGHPSGQ